MFELEEHGFHFQFRGFPVSRVSDGVMAMLREPGRDVSRELARILREAEDFRPGLAIDFLYRSRIGTAEVIIELVQRFIGVKSDPPGFGYWSIHLPGESAP